MDEVPAIWMCHAPLAGPARRRSKTFTPSSGVQRICTRSCKITGALPLLRRSPTPLSLGLSGLREDMLALQSAPSLPSSLRVSGQAFADSHRPATAARHACATAKANALDLDPANANLAPSLRTALHKRWRTLAWIACGHSGHWRGSNGDRPSTVLGPRSLSSRPSTSAARRGHRRQWGDVALPWHVSAADTFGST